METFALVGLMVLLLLLVAASLFTKWQIACVRKTGAQRIAILDEIKGAMGTDRFDAMLEEFQGVDFERHMKALTFRKNPFDLYGPLIKEAMSK